MSLDQTKFMEIARAALDVEIQLLRENFSHSEVLEKIAVSAFSTGARWALSLDSKELRELVR